MIYVATLVPLGALVVAALGLVLTYRERISVHRSALYDRQLQAFQELSRGLAELNNEVLSFVIGGPIPEERRIKLRELVASKSSAYIDAFRESAVILPRPVATALVEYQQVFNAISAPSEVASQYPEGLVRSADPVMDLGKANERVVDLMREHSGVDKLSAQTVKMIGPRLPDDSTSSTPAP